MKIQTTAVHAGDRKKPGSQIAVTTPIHTAASYVCESMEQQDRIFGKEEPGYAYARYDNPTNAALEELLNGLEGGETTLACASGMSAIQIAVQAALTDRRKSVVAANALYGATINLLRNVFEPMGVDIAFVDVCDAAALEQAVVKARPGCIVMETVSNPLLRVGDIAKVGALARECGAALLVDNTFATPMMVRPLELGANMVVHSLTKYLSGHGDVLGGSVTGDAAHMDLVRTLSRTYGPVLGPFEAYLTMRGIKTFPLRFERQCRNAMEVAQWLCKHPKVSRVYYLADRQHPDGEVIARQFAPGIFGAMVSFELKDSAKGDVFAVMDRMKLIVRATSLGDVHTMVLYPAISSHRDISPKQRERMGIRENLIRMSVGIEAVEDIVSDLECALA